MQLSDSAIKRYKTSIDGLTLSQAQAKLSTSVLNDEQKKQVLISAGLTKANESVTATEIKQAITENILTTEKQQEVLATFEQEIAEGKLSLERLEAIALEDTETGAIARIIIAKRGENAQNLKNIASGKALNTVLKEQLVLLLKNPLTWVVIATGAVIGLAKVVEELVVTEEELNEQIEELQSNWSELSSTIQSSAQSFQSLKKQADELIPRYAELAQGVDKYGKNVSLTDEEFSEFVSLNNQLGQMFPELVMGYDSNGNAILALSGNVDTLTESLYAFVEAQRIASAQTIADTMPEVMSNIDSTVEAYEAKIQNVEAERQALEDLYNTFKNEGFVEEWSSVGESMVSAVKILDKYGIDYSSEITGERNGVVGSTRYKITVDWDDFETAYNGRIAGFEKEVDDLIGRIEAKWKQLNPVVSAWLSTDFLYQDLDMSGQSLVTAMVGEIDFKELGKTTEEEIQNYITNSIITPIYDMDTKTQQAFFEVFDLHEALNKGELSVQEYQDKINAILENGTYSQEFTTIFKLAFAEGDLQEEYDKAIAKFGEDNKDTLAKFFTDNSINTTEEIEYWNKVTDGAQSAVEAVEMYNKVKSETSNKTTGSFSTIFNSSDFSEQKQSLLDLAKAGELTNKALSSDDYSDFIDKLEEIGISAEEAKTEILSLLDATEKLSGASKSISGLENAYNEFKEKGYVLAETIEFIPDVFRELETYDFDVFENIIGNPKNIEQMQGAFNDLVTAYISEMAVLSDVSEAEAQRFISNLEEMGVTNADTVVNSVLALNDSMKATAKEAESTAQEINEFLVNVKGKAASATNDLTNCTWSEINALIEEGNKFGYTTSKIEEFAMQKIWANRNSINTSDDIAQLLAVAKAAGFAATSISAYENAVKLQKQGYGGGDAWVQSMQASAWEDVLKEIEESFNFTPTVSYKAPTSSSSSSTSSSKEAEKTAEEIDWIEKLLERIQSRIDSLDKTASSTYRAWSTRNKALLDELKEVNGEIKAQQKAYDVYMAKANSVGLSEHYKQLVQNGDYSIEDITDDTLKDQISSYEEWYNKAMDCSDAITDLKDRISELGMTQFENLVTQYEDKLGSYAHEVEMLQTYIDQTEAKGYALGGNYYKQLISVQELNIAKLKEQYESLKDSLQSSVDTGKVKVYSESWYDMVDSIRNVQKSIEDANTSLIEYQNNLRDLEWESFDRLADKISKISEESDFLISLMSDEKMFTEEGITDEGQATLGLHAINYNTYLTQADEYAREIQKINGELADDPHNDTLVDRRQELLDLQQQSILASEEEKQAIRNLVQDGYDVFLESLQKIIDKRKDMLKDIKSLHDFEKEIGKQTSEVAKLEKILKAYEGDNSEEARAKIQEYKVSLEEAESALEETEYDKYIQDQEQMLDTIYSQAEEFVNQRLDNLSQLVSDVIDSTNENASEINETIKESADDVGYTISSKLANAFNSASNGVSDLVSDYNDNFLETMTTLQASVDAIRNLIAGTSDTDSESFQDNYANDKMGSFEKLEELLSTPQNKWTQDTNGTWNYYEGGEQVKDSWTKYDKDNKWYHLDSEGNMSTSKWIKNDSGTWSYVNDLGQALTGWHKLDWQGSKDWYSFDDEGNMHENQWIDDYFVAKNGKMLTNTWIGHNGKYYWVGEDGKWLNKPGWSLDYKPNDGLPLYEYAKGSKRIPKDQLALVGEKGQEVQLDSSEGVLKVVGKGDMVFTNEASRKLWEFSQDPEGYMAKLGLSGLKPVEFAIPNISSMNKMPEIQRVAPNQNVNIQLGDIQMYGVNNPQEFAKQLKSTINNNSSVRKQLKDVAFGDMSSGNSFIRYAR